MKNTLAVALVAGSLLTAGLALAAGTQTKTTTTKTTTMTTQTTAPVKSDIPADLARQAKIDLDTARSTALARVQHGRVRSEELEKEHGKLIYSFDIAVPGKSGVEEVNVDAITGKVVAKHHESAKDEQKEEAKEHKPSGR